MADSLASGIVSLEKYQRLADEYQRLKAAHEALVAKHAKCSRYVKEATEKYEVAKANAKQWWAWAESKGYRRQWKQENLVESSVSSGIVEDERPVTSSQTTEDDTTCIAVENSKAGSDDEPEVVSARSLKRKRGGETAGLPPPVRVKIEPNSQNDPIGLGSNDYSSPVLTRQKPIRTETSDLDATVVHITTPRKRRTFGAQSEEAAKPTTLLPGVSSLSEGNQPGGHDDDVRIRSEAIGTMHEITLADARDLALQHRDCFAENNVLRQRSINVPSKASPGNIRKANNRKRTPNIVILSEDGECGTNQAQARRSEPESRANSGHRLDALLDNPSPDRQFLPKQSSPEPRLVRQTKDITPSTTQAKPTVKGRPERGRAKFRFPRGLDQSPSIPEPEDEPLRLRPLKRLCLDDFKINPNYLGSDYAFADTLRGRDQRRCLPGCTRPECCGGIMKAAEMGVLKSSKSDNQVLEEYLGPEYATLIGAYGPDTRTDLLVRAHAFAFANEHGKHRHAFERRSTPPGFWRIDMPSTQEEQQDREKAVSMEREKIEERWREAMRGGRWLFRDE